MMLRFGPNNWENRPAVAPLGENSQGRLGIWGRCPHDS